MVRLEGRGAAPVDSCCCRGGHHMHTRLGGCEQGMSEEARGGKRNAGASRARSHAGGDGSSKRLSERYCIGGGVTVPGECSGDVKSTTQRRASTGQHGQRAAATCACPPWGHWARRLAGSLLADMSMRQEAEGAESERFDASSGSAEVQPCCARPWGENHVAPHAPATASSESHAGADAPRCRRAG